MEKISEHITDLLVLFVNNELDDKGIMELKDWAESSEDNMREFCRMREIRTANSFERLKTVFDSDAAYARFKMNTRVPASKSHIWNGFLKYSLGFMALVSVVILSFRLGSNSLENSFAEIVMEAPLGSLSKVVLPDSTEVWLNSGSRISYSQGFGVKDRKLKMTGEGFFSVSKNPDMPFSISTEGLVVEVLGTKFDLRNYSDDKEAYVSLEEGRVSLENLICKSELRYLEPNQKMILDKSSGVMEISGSEAENASQWVKGNLFFDEELLTDIVRELERAYNVSIVIGNEELRNYRFYGNFVQKDQTIDEVLSILSATQKINSIREGKTITLY